MVNFFLVVLSIFVLYILEQSKLEILILSISSHAFASFTKISIAVLSCLDKVSLTIHYVFKLLY